MQATPTPQLPHPGITGVSWLSDDLPPHGLNRRMLPFLIRPRAGSVETARKDWRQPRNLPR